MELLCCGRTHYTTQTTVTQKCQRPENPQHNNLKLFSGFSGRWHSWATVKQNIIQFDAKYNTKLSIL